MFPRGEKGGHSSFSNYLLLISFFLIHIKHKIPLFHLKEEKTEYDDAVLKLIIMIL